jgi:hypothetical protein
MPGFIDRTRDILLVFQDNNGVYYTRDIGDILYNGVPISENGNEMEYIGAKVELSQNLIEYEVPEDLVEYYKDMIRDNPGWF